MTPNFRWPTSSRDLPPYASQHIKPLSTARHLTETEISALFLRRQATAIIDHPCRNHAAIVDLIHGNLHPIDGQRIPARGNTAQLASNQTAKGGDLIICLLYTSDAADE